MKTTWGGTELKERFKTTVLKVLVSQLEMPDVKFVLSLEAMEEVLTRDTNLVSLAHRL